MKADNILDLQYYRRQKDEEILHQKIIKIAENARRLGSVIQLKNHFKEWLLMNKDFGRSSNG